jgi:hypothetical protein
LQELKNFAQAIVKAVIFIYFGEIRLPIVSRYTAPTLQKKRHSKPYLEHPMQSLSNLLDVFARISSEQLNSLVALAALGVAISAIRFAFVAMNGKKK